VPPSSPIATGFGTSNNRCSSVTSLCVPETVPASSSPTIEQNSLPRRRSGSMMVWTGIQGS